MEALADASPKLRPFLFRNKYGTTTIDFFSPQAVNALNQAILSKDYNIQEWTIPDGFLCPAVPGRAEYILHAADVLSTFSADKFPRGKGVRVLDIGTGANLIYPILGNSLFGWSFVGSEINQLAIDNAKAIVDANGLQNIELRMQPDRGNILKGIIKEDDFFDLVICNPPFHADAVEAQKNATRKFKNLKSDLKGTVKLNFDGHPDELITKGGEVNFLKRYIAESKTLEKSALVFSSLVSKAESLDKLLNVLKSSDCSFTKKVDIQIGNKKSRIIAWSFFNEKEITAWRMYRNG